MTLVVRVCDDEERVGHVVLRLARHVRALGLSFEILVADEGSGDNTLAVAALLKRVVPELEVLHAPPGRGYYDACARARGRAILLYDVRADAPLAGLGLALERLRAGTDVVAIGGRWLVFRRTRAWRAFDALTVRRDYASLERRFLRRARAISLTCELNHPRRRTPWRVLRDTLRLSLRTA